MASDRGGGGGVHSVRRSSSSCSSLAFVDVAFADMPFSAEGAEQSGCELHVFEGPLASERSRPATSASTIRCSHHSVEGSDGRTPRLSLASRFFLREFFHGEAPAEGIGDDETRRGSTWSSECSDVMLSCSPRGEDVEPRRQLEERPNDTAVFISDPAERVKYSSSTTWRVLWASGGFVLVLVIASAAVSHITLGHAFKKLWEIETSSRLASEGSDVVSHTPTTEAPVVSPNDWRAPQIAADSLYAILVLFSILMWIKVQRRLRAAVLMRFGACLLWGLILKVFLSATFWFAYRPVGIKIRSSSFADTAVLALRFISGLTLSEDVDGVPGYCRMITSQLFVFWCLYTWHTPVFLLPSTALTLSILILGSVGSMRSVFDAILTLTLVAVVCVVYHALLDSAARALFLKLRADMGTQEAQTNRQPVQQRRSAVYTPTLQFSRLTTNSSSFYGYIPQGGFISTELWNVLADWTGSVEYLEERVRLTLRRYGLHISQQRNVHLVPQARSALQAEERGLPVTSRSAAERDMHILVDDRMIWTTICENYTPRPTRLCGQQGARKVTFCLGKCKNRVVDGDNSPSQRDSSAA